ILPRTDLEGAKIVFDRIRKKIETYDFGCRVTISGGIAFVDESIYLDRLIEMADQALYQAKKSKNRMVVYGR
ncbi:MAG TPA: diguanylate cyclase, partial [Clostridiales bacterium]|nr:diguanylate cyclase [Clostridiales bacterium]